MIVGSALERISRPNVLRPNVLAPKCLRPNVSRPNVCAQMSGFEFAIYAFVKINMQSSVTVVFQRLVR